MYGLLYGLYGSYNGIPWALSAEGHCTILRVLTTPIILFLNP